MDIHMTSTAAALIALCGALSLTLASAVIAAAIIALRDNRRAARRAQRPLFGALRRIADDLAKGNAEAARQRRDDRLARRPR